MSRVLHRCSDAVRAMARCRVGLGRHALALVLGVWVGASGCGGATVASSAEREDEGAGSASAELLCDGGDRVRFAAWAGLGRAGPELVFSADPAAQFITIDGHCTFWLYDGSLEGLRTGVLDADFARQLSRELHLGRYAEVEAYRSRACLDAGEYAIRDGTASLSNPCGLNDAAPRLWVEAFERTDRLWTELAARSESAWGPTVIVPFRDVQPAGDRVFHDWTSSFNLAEHVMSGEDFERAIYARPQEVGVRLEDAPTLALLAELRERAIAGRNTPTPSNPWYEFVPPQLSVRDAQGNAFTILLRDQIPEAVVNGLWSP
jgi:hypothetical protein